MLPVWPDNTRDVIEQIIEMIGRQVTFYNVVSLSGCDLCNLDPITNTSTDSYCPTCSGEYWIPTLSGTELTAHVTWGTSEHRAWETGGIIDDGKCTIKFMYSGWMEDIIHDPEFVIVDDREMDVERITLRGVKEINRVIVHLKEKEL